MAEEFEIEIPGQGPVVFESEDQARDYLKRHPITPPKPLATNFAVKAPPLAPSAGEQLRSRADELTRSMDKKQLANAGAAIKVATDSQGEKLPKDVIEKMANYRYMMGLLTDLAETKNYGFNPVGEKRMAVEAPVDTGPIAQYYPKTASAFIARKFEGKDPYTSSARTALNQQLTKIIGPVQKEQTGAQAAYAELQNLIKPQMPTEGDDDDPFNRKLIDSARLLVEKQRNEMNAFRQQGYNVPDDYNIEPMLSGFSERIPKRYHVSAPKKGAQ